MIHLCYHYCLKIMKAIAKTQKQAGLKLIEVPSPKISETQVLIRVKKASICGTDVSINSWSGWAAKTIVPPRVIGHEFVGEVVEVGASVARTKPGDRVTAEGHLTCGSCKGCLTGKRHLCKNAQVIGIHTDGCFAEYVKVPESNVFILPESISDEMASIFDPYGNAVHTALSFPLAAKDVLITGAGPIGVMAAAIAKKCGARRIVVTDIRDNRLELAKKMGATEVVNVSGQTVSGSFDVGLEMSGSPQALEMMLHAMEPGGKIALLGLIPTGAGIDWDQVIFKMLEIKGIYGREIFDTWIQMVNLLESGLDLTPVITHRFAAEEFEKGFEVMQNGLSGKVILEWEK